tara:strand:- start:102 stop:311 length:210 start_codon:yes stop_codon:yes gene_type:complete
MEIVGDIILRLGYWLIVGVMPNLIIIPVVATVMKIEINALPKGYLILWFLVSGAIITQLIPNHPLYLGG